MTLVIDDEFKSLIPALLPEEFKQLEMNILQDGEIKEPLAIWKTDKVNLLLDGHNRYKVANKNNIAFLTTEIDLIDRDHAKLWIATHQLGRRNLTDDQRAYIANEIRDIRSKIAKRISEENLLKGTKKPESAKSAQSGRTSTLIANESKLPERKIRLAQEIKKIDPIVSEMVRSGDISLVEGRKIANLSIIARQMATKSVKNGKDVRTAIREAKKENYNTIVAASKPKKLEGTYRILYADPPWKYIGLNQVDEYGHAECHYDCLDDNQLKNYKVGNRLVKDIMDKNSVLFIWVTSPMLERCFPIIEAWGFEYKSSFVWDKVKHNMGHYNSVRHELLLISTKGSCKPDIPKLVDSVQSIERSNKHSEKPEEFRTIIDSLYDHGRRLELFHRGKPPEGWDAEGNEVI